MRTSTKRVDALALLITIIGACVFGCVLGRVGEIWLSFYMAEWCNSNTTFQEIVENGAIPFSADRKGELYLQFYGDSLNRTSDRMK